MWGSVAAEPGGFTPSVLKNSVRSERGYSPRATLRGSIPLPRTFSQPIAITLAPSCPSPTWTAQTISRRCCAW